MGSGISKSDTNGVMLPAKFRTIFIQRIEEFASRRHSRPLKDPTPSKKELLSHDNENSNHGKRFEEQKLKAKGSEMEKCVATKIDTTHDVVNVENLKEKGKDERKENVMQDEEDVFKDFDDEDEDEDDDDEDGRMIGHEDDEAFPRSPSFRVYFNDNGEDDHDDDYTGKDDGHKSKAPSIDTVSVSTKDPSVRKKGKNRKKRRSFKNVFQQGGQAAVKNILNVTACYTPSHSSQERNRLLANKANT